MLVESIAVLGPGLLGGSILHDAMRLGVPSVRAYARRLEVCQEIDRLSLAHMATTDLARAVHGVSLIVLASPVGAYPQLVQSLLRCPLADDVLITDVGSVKGMVLATAGKLCRAAGRTFIGSHPMAGSEAKGLLSSKARLFEQAACILTPEVDTPPAALQRLTQFWTALGCSVSTMDGARHDEVVARISHMPHLAAVAVTLAALGEDTGIAQFAAGGLRDTTRVASGDPDMWREILLENRPAVLAAGRDLQRKLAELLDLLEAEQEMPLMQALETAKKLRDQRYA
jgi:prephenate dehydrogenase